MASLRSRVKKKQSRPVPVAPQTNAQTWKKTLWDRHWEARLIADHVKTNDAPPELRKVVNALDNLDFLDAEPSEEYSRAIDAVRLTFDALPAEERRRILNGWNWEPMQWDADSPHSQIAQDCFVALQIDNGLRRPAHFGLNFTPGSEALRLSIRPGTTQAQAVAEVRRMLALVEHEWSTLITNPDKAQPPENAPRFGDGEADNFACAIEKVAERLSGKDATAAEEVRILLPDGTVWETKTAGQIFRYLSLRIDPEAPSARAAGGTKHHEKAN